MSDSEVITLRLWVTGYRSYELNIYNEQDKKLAVIKAALKTELSERIENGLEWILTGGQLGIEQWTIEVGLDLKKDFPELKLAMLLPFSNFSEKWKPEKQQHLQELKTAVDFSAEVSKQPYRSPQQLKNYQIFMLNHTEGALMVYDPEYPGKSRYDHEAILKKQQASEYGLELLDMLSLQDTAALLAERDED
ncbi:DUF1273 domain-containing protein [Ligilactobacillus salitolerans]|uniref:DUF1273 domain-containing protein n=1 Tax=Ligilactobacillus salitolerans TaxID=1808352 RepID=UPI000F605DEA|nr:DUF1273 domain-containing protein [Ligilactobacillus salitolerans]